MAINISSNQDQTKDSSISVDRNLWPSRETSEEKKKLCPSKGIRASE